LITAAGVDTWSVCWYLQDQSPPCKAMEALATIPAPRSKLIEDEVCGHRVGWFPGTRLLFAEGHPSGQGLCKADALPAALDALSEGLADLGVLPPAVDLRPVHGPEGPRPWRQAGFGGVRRLDSTVDLAFDDPMEGLTALAAVGSLPLPRIKTKVIREVGGRRVETVYFHGSSGRTVLARWYDKGIESGDARRGIHVRPEDQRRFAKDARLTVDAIAQGTYVRDAFVKRFEPLWKAAKGVKVAGVIELAQRLAELQEEGLITPGEAKAMAGHLLLESAGAHRQSRSQHYKDRAACRRHGLVLADGPLDHVEVDLGEVMERALDSEAWGAQG
jgi:hypothetical protein